MPHLELISLHLASGAGYSTRANFVRDPRGFSVTRLVADKEFIEVFVEPPIDECARRDPKGRYVKATAGMIRNFTGFDSPHETVEIPEVHLQTVGQKPEQTAERVLLTLAELGIAE